MTNGHGASPLLTPRHHHDCDPLGHRMTRQNDDRLPLGRSAHRERSAIRVTGHVELDFRGSTAGPTRPPGTYVVHFERCRYRSLPALVPARQQPGVGRDPTGRGSPRQVRTPWVADQVHAEPEPPATPRCPVVQQGGRDPLSYTHLRAHETVLDLVCRLLLEKKKKQ